MSYKIFQPIPTASYTAEGVIHFATSGEVISGLIEDAAINPATLKYYFDNSTGTSGFLQSEINLLNSQTGEYYLRSNPSGYISSSSLTPYALVTSLESTGQTLQNEIAQLNGQTGNYYTKDNPSHYSTSGDLSLISGNLQNDINNRLLASQTGNFYPSYNPNNYSSSGDLTSSSGYLQGEINLINSSGLISTGNADLRYYPKSSNPSGYIPLTSGDSRYYGGNNPSGFISSIPYASNISSGAIYLGAYNCLSVYTGNVVSRSGVSSNDGATPRTGIDSVLLTAQTTGAQNGPWVTNSGNWTRPNWYSSGNTGQAFYGANIFITSGTSGGGTTWKINTTGAITIDTTSVSFAKIVNTIATTGSQGEVAGLATSADVRGFSDNTKAVTSLVLIDLIQQYRIRDLLLPTPTNTGTASCGAGVAGDINLQSGTTANSTSTTGMSFVSFTNASVAGAGSNSGVDWTKPITLFFSWYYVFQTANGIFRIGIKPLGFGQPATRGVVLEFRNARMWVVAHDGTTLTQTDTGVDTVNMSGAYMTISGGNVSVYGKFNTLLWSGAAGAPTTIGNNGDNNVVLNITNGADAAQHRISIVRNVFILGG